MKRIWKRSESVRDFDEKCATLESGVQNIGLIGAQKGLLGFTKNFRGSLGLFFLCKNKHCQIFEPQKGTGAYWGLPGLTRVHWSSPGFLRIVGPH